MRCATATGAPRWGSSTNRRLVPIPPTASTRPAMGLRERKSNSSQPSAPSAASPPARGGRARRGGAGGGGGRGRAPPPAGGARRARPRAGNPRAGGGPPPQEPQQRLDVRGVRPRVPPHLSLVLRELQGNGGRQTQALAQELLGEFGKPVFDRGVEVPDGLENGQRHDAVDHGARNLAPH